MQSLNVRTGDGTTVPVELIAVGFSIVGSVLREMSAPFRPPDPLMKTATVSVPPAVSEKLIGAVGQPVAVSDDAIQTVPF